jgi:hypothetical protein
LVTNGPRFKTFDERLYYNERTVLLKYGTRHIYLSVSKLHKKKSTEHITHFGFYGSTGEEDRHIKLC